MIFLNPFFITLVYKYFWFVFMYIKIFKNLSAKSFKESIERVQEKSLAMYQNLSKEEK